MTLRTTILAICMVAVPGVALFSHRVPADVRAGAREAVATLVAWCRDAVMPARSDTVAPPEPSALAEPPQDGSVAVSSPAASPADRPDPPEAVLARLGATAVECRPLPGPHGGHVASCAVALDADGQLLRVFHGTGGDHEAALTALATEIDGWRNRSPERAQPRAPTSSATRP